MEWVAKDQSGSSNSKIASNSPTSSSTSSVGYSTRENKDSWADFGVQSQFGSNGNASTPNNRQISTSSNSPSPISHPSPPTINQVSNEIEINNYNLIVEERTKNGSNQRRNCI